jgi:hypothetical protein
MDGSETSIIKFREMPKNIRRFVWLWFGTYPISVAAQFLTPVEVSDPEISSFNYWVITAIVMFIFSGVDVLLSWQAVWRRKNWARWALLVYALIFLPWMFEDVVVPVIFLDSLVVATNALALFFLFTGDARPWFGAPDPTATASNFD